ncbi:MAG: shikimate 5-dehydrogenase [Verrucomicrobia bacterium]|nr:shikimate 5-dehydrogenase [Verrucomicrobiota bacterium]
MQLHINKDTQLCMSLAARPGNFGTRFHNFLYRELGLNFIYKAFTTRDLRSAIGGIRALGIRGCAISMPFKEAVIEYLDELDASAKRIQSVNTILNNNGYLTAYNTDYTAVSKLLRSSRIANSARFALLGSGGMAKAIACALRDGGFANGLIVARNEVNGPELAHQFGFQWKRDPTDEKPDLLINAMPVGMAGGAEATHLPVPENLVRSAQFVFDVVALPPETPLIQLARSLGKITITGSEVSVLQAVEQFVIYTGVRPAAELIEKAAGFARLG